MSRRITFSGSLVLLCLFCTASITTASADDLTIRNGFAKTFALGASPGSALTAGLARGGPGSAMPRQGEITVTLSTTHAVGAPKLHVYNRFGKAIRFEAAATKSSKPLGTSLLCGHVDTDSWIVLPAATTDARLSHFTEVATGCP